MDEKYFKKVELHVHLDGSVRPSTLSEIKGITIEEAEKRLIAPEKCSDLNDYLTKFTEPVSIMQTEENLTRISRELCEDLLKDNCIYAEIRFAPNKHNSIISLDNVIESVLKGMHETSLKCNLLLCMMRGEPFLENKKIIDLAYRYLNQGVVGVDLAGAEGIYPTSDYEELFTYAKEKGIPFTIHAGEAAGKESIISAISFGASRLGHGVRAIEDENCLQIIKDKNITLEICPTSNVQTNICNNLAHHPIKKLLDENILICLNTDNRTVSNVTLSDEYKNLIDIGFKEQDFIRMNINAINAAFLSNEEKTILLNELKNRE